MEHLLKLFWKKYLDYKDTDNADGMSLLIQCMCAEQSSQKIV